MNLFDNIDKTEAYTEEQRQYFSPGNYRIRVENVYTKPKRMGGSLFIVETTVLGSDSDDIKIGDKRNWVQSMDMAAALSRIKMFIGVAKGFNPKTEVEQINKEITPKLCELSVSSSNPLKDTEFDLECYQRRSIKTGKDFTIHLWKSVNDQK